MAKQIIRHLEYYGFPDQNNFISEASTDSYIDKKQDWEIHKLGHDLYEFRHFQHMFNDRTIKINNDQSKKINELVDEGNSLESAVASNTHDIITISGSVEDIIAEVKALPISSITEDLQKAINDIEAISGSIDDANVRIDEVNEKADTIQRNLNEYAIYADNKFAVKEDVYTKEEVDEKISDSEASTKEWVIGQGYLTKESGDSMYSKIEAMDALSSLVNESIDRINGLSGNLESYKEYVSNEFNSIKDEFITFSGATDDRFNDVNSLIDSCDEKIDANTASINDTNYRLNGLSGDVSNLSSVVDEKLDKLEFETYKVSALARFTDLDFKKANKSELRPIIESIVNVDDKLTQETHNRKAGDDSIQDQINEIVGNVDTLSGGVEQNSDRIDELERNLTQEISDREQGDISLIGDSHDSLTANTIYGAKKYAEIKKSEAIASANTYTNGQKTYLMSLIEAEHSYADQIFSSAASRTFVTNLVNETKNEVIEKIDNDVSSERVRAEGAETNLGLSIAENRRDINSNREFASHLADRVNAITAWEGTDPSEYVNSGNGVLDVLHREFHEYIKTDGVIDSIEYDESTGDLVIKYHTITGEKETRIHVGDLVDLTNYYTKDETEERLGTKVDLSAFTIAIMESSGRIDEVDSKIDDEIDRATSVEDNLQEQINMEIQNRVADVDAEEARAKAEEDAINDRIDNLTIDCGIY